MRRTSTPGRGSSNKSTPRRPINSTIEQLRTNLSRKSSLATTQATASSLSLNPLEASSSTKKKTTFSDVTPSGQVGKAATRSSIARSVRRYTPYGRTPQVRQLHSKTGSLNIPASSGKKRTGSGKQPKSRKAPSKQGEPAITELKGLTSKTWKVFKLSPLYKFDPKNFKRLSKHLSGYVEAERHKGTWVDNEAVVNKCEMCWYKGIKLSEVDPEAVQIIIRGATKTVEDTILLTAVLCSVAMEDHMIKKPLQEHFTYFPLLLIKGNIGITDILNSWLEMQFDCKVTPMTFKSYDLAWMVSMWGGTADSSRKNKDVQLIYKVPKLCNGMSRITYTLDPEDCLHLWQQIHPVDSDQFTAEEVTTFMKSLESHFHKIFKVKLSTMMLMTVGTPLCYVGSEGRLKMFLADQVHDVLQYLTELAAEWSFPYS